MVFPMKQEDPGASPGDCGRGCGGAADGQAAGQSIPGGRKWLGLGIFSGGNIGYHKFIKAFLYI